MSATQRGCAPGGANDAAEYSDRGVVGCGTPEGQLRSRRDPADVGGKLAFIASPPTPRLTSSTIASEEGMDDVADMAVVTPEDDLRRAAASRGLGEGGGGDNENSENSENSENNESGNDGYGSCDGDGANGDDEDDTVILAAPGNGSSAFTKISPLRKRTRSVFPSWTPLRLVSAAKRKGKRDKGQPHPNHQPRMGITGGGIDRAKAVSSPPLSPRLSPQPLDQAFSLDSSSSASSSEDAPPLSIFKVRKQPPASPPGDRELFRDKNDGSDIVGFVEKQSNSAKGRPVETARARTTMMEGSIVYDVDQSLGVFVAEALTPAECDNLVGMAEKHVTSSILQGKVGWRKLYTYTKLDLPFSEILGSNPGVKDWLMKKICAILGCYYGCDPKLLKPRTWKEPHFLKVKTAL